MQNQSGDVLLFNELDGGNIKSQCGYIEMSESPDTSVYLSLFGGNEDDSGADNDKNSWWGNIDELDEMAYRSETQNILQSLPITPFNLIKIKDAVKRDLSWLSKPEVSVYIIAANTIKIEVELLDLKYTFIFNEKLDKTITCSNDEQPIPDTNIKDSVQAGSGVISGGEIILEQIPNTS